MNTTIPAFEHLNSDYISTTILNRILNLTLNWFHFNKFLRFRGTSGRRGGGVPTAVQADGVQWPVRPTKVKGITVWMLKWKCN